MINKPMARLKDEQIVASVRQMLYRADGYDLDEQIEDIEEALDYYYQRPRGDEVQGRSQVVSGDLSAMTEAVLSQTMPAFAGRNLAEFEPEGPSDEDQAHLESVVVSKCLNSSNNGYVELQTALKDALLTRIGVLKVFKDDEENVEKIDLTDVPEDAFGELEYQDPLNSVTIENVKEQDDGNFEVKMKKVTIKQKLCIEAVPPEYFLYTSDWDKHDLQRCPLVAHRMVSTRSDLVERYKFSKEKVDKLPPHATDRTRAGDARNPDKYMEDRHQMNDDRSMDWVEWYECYVLIDIDGDGIAERWKIAMSNDEILGKEEVTCVPFCVGNAFIAPHRMLGVSLYDKLKQVQDINTGLYRALMDNINTAIKNKNFYLDGKVNPDDLSDGRPNANVRVKSSVGDVRTAVTTITPPDLTQGLLSNIAEMRTVRAEMGGASLEMQSGEAQLASHQVGSQGLDRAYAVFEQLSSLVNENFAHTLIKGLFKLVHKTYREQWIGEVAVKSEGNWITADPAQWPERTDVCVKVGMSHGDRMRKAEALKEVLATQLQLAGEGLDGVLVDEVGFYEALMDRCRVLKVDNPEQYFIDPRSERAQQSKQQKGEEAQAQTEAQAKLMEKAIVLEELRSAMDKYKVDEDNKFKVWEKLLDAEIEEAKLMKDISMPAPPTPGQLNGANGQGAQPPQEGGEAAQE